MNKNFRTFILAVEFYRLVRDTVAGQLPCHLKEQLLRAASSIPLNLAEGRGKSSTKDQVRFFSIALGSLRECQAIMIIAELEGSECWSLLDRLGAYLYKLIRNVQ